MVDLIGLSVIAEEYQREFELLHTNPNYVATKREEAFDALRQAYLKTRGDDLKCENSAWLDRMGDVLQQDINRIRAAQTDAQAGRTDLTGRGQDLINQETRLVKLRRLEELLKNKWNVAVRIHDQALEFHSADGAILLTRPIRPMPRQGDQPTQHG